MMALALSSRVLFVRPVFGYELSVVLGDDITILLLSCRYIWFVCAGAFDINDCSNSREADISHSLRYSRFYPHSQSSDVTGGPESFPSNCHIIPVSCSSNHH